MSAQIVYAKYITAGKISSKLSLAKPIFIVEGKEVAQINEKNNIGYYEFLIKNFNETHISETAFVYTIEILSNLDEEIQFELYNNDVRVPLEDLKTPQISIIGNEKAEQKYMLKVIYDTEKNKIKQDVLGEVQIKIFSEQEERNG